MFVLRAQGPHPSDLWQQPLPDGAMLLLGRACAAGAVPWEPYLSRRHAEVVRRGRVVSVRRLPEATNPLFHGGVAADAFELALGDGFVIGTTLFTLEEELTPPDSAAEASPLHARTIAYEELQQVAFAPQRLDVLQRLPQVIRGAADERELLAGLADLLLAGIQRADVAAVVTPQTVLHWERRRGGGDFVPSHRLVHEAIRVQKQTVLHVWAAAPGEVRYSLYGNFDWAFCTPIRSETCPEWGLYLTGQFLDTPTARHGQWDSLELREDVKFTELAAEILAALRQVQQLRERQGLFRRFFSPAVLELLAGQDAAAALAPQEAEVTVLFCDLRGFSRNVETANHALLAALQRVSAALGLMTQAILRHGGVIADFLGDAALGFWGWPVPQPQRMADAARAALDIQSEFAAAAAAPDHPLHAFRVGIGIASGRAVAGGIGTAEQVKVTVFGPVVNLASRLQDMTKLLRAPILLDEATAAALRQSAAQVARVRRLARVVPFGLSQPLTVAELLPPAGPACPLSDADIATYEQALDAFISGDWDAAYRLLHRVPPEDRGKDLLMEMILRHGRRPPPDWTGAIPLHSKS